MYHHVIIACGRLRLSYAPHRALLHHWPGALELENLVGIPCPYTLVASSCQEADSRICAQVCQVFCVSFRVVQGVHSPQSRVEGPHRRPLHGVKLKHPNLPQSLKKNARVHRQRRCIADELRNVAGPGNISLPRLGHNPNFYQPADAQAQRGAAARGRVASGTQYPINITRSTRQTI